MKPSDITRLKDEALAEVGAAADAAALEAVRVKYLGRSGLLPEIMKGIGKADPADRKEIGQKANEFKNDIQAAVDTRKAALEEQALARQSRNFDVTLPGRWHGAGSLHPVTQIIDRMTDIFTSLGFGVADGPDIDTVFNNFDALNHPDDHPARAEKDTFYLSDGTLLRTHTSPVQVRYMKAHPPPVRIIAPGRCYRRDATDATHSANFHQMEALYVDKGVSLADLKSDLDTCARELMGPGVKTRLRPHFFPFTEPSVEFDFSCHVCNGKGCRVCKHSGWIEIGGAGMVNPNVFKAVGYDAETYTGYAFGMGLERIAMILYGIPDIRMLYENDVRFLEQFG